MKLKRKDGKILSSVRKKWLVETPEEYVRQEYLLVLFHEYGYCLEQIAEEVIDLIQFNRVGAVKQRMYTENLCHLRIPYLPESEQREFAQAREKALANIDVAKDYLAQARKDIEAMILGVKKV